MEMYLAKHEFNLKTTLGSRRCCLCPYSSKQKLVIVLQVKEVESKMFIHQLNN